MKTYAIIAAAALALAACTPASTDTAETDAATTPAAEATGFTPQDLSALIASMGPQEALAELFRDPTDPRWTTAMTGISRGDLAWITAVAPLVPVLDGEAAESGFSAYGDALTSQPEAVLAAVGADGMESTCQPYPAETLEAKQSALAAISDESPVAALRDECLTALSGEPT
jgi:hypothetical protein